MSDKWWDMSDDELDDLFREASDKVDIPFDSSAFNKLRHKIDNQPKAESPRSSSRRWLLPLLALLLMVGVGVVYRYVTPNTSEKETYVVDNKQVEQNNSINLTKKSPQSIIPNKQTNSPQKETESLAKNSESSITKHEKLNHPIIKNNNSEELVPQNNAVVVKTTPQTTTLLPVVSAYSARVGNKTQQKQITKETSEKSLDRIEQNVTENPQKTTSTDGIASNSSEQYRADNQLINDKVKTLPLSTNRYQKQRGNQPFITKESSTDKQNIQLSDTYSTTYNTNTEANITESDIRTNFFGVNTLAPKNSKHLINQIPIELPPFIDSLPRKVASPKFSRFGLRLAFAPDINSIEYLETSALGSSIGLLLEYKLNKRFVLQTGLVYSSKKYGGEFDYYHSWTGTWQKYHPAKPTEVDGGCKVLDIPLNIRFNAFQKPKQTWFISAGISSYLMMKETYTYKYAWMAPKTVDWADETSYYWSTLNLSVGLEKRLTKHFTLQAEPYLKTPLTGVGRGSVNLYSSGILFSTKYEF